MTTNGSGPAAVATAVETRKRVPNKNASEHSARQSRPLRRYSDQQLDELAEAIRDERRRRGDKALYQTEADRHRPKGARYGRSFQLNTMRRLGRWP